MTNNFSVFEGINGIRGVVVSSVDGTLMYAMEGATPKTEEMAGALAMCCRQLSSVGQLLRLGTYSLGVIRSERSMHTLVSRMDSSAAIETDPKRVSADLESKLRLLDWTTQRPLRPAVPPPLPSVRQQPLPAADAREARTMKGGSGDTMPTEARASAAVPSVPVVRVSEPAKQAKSTRTHPIPSLPPPVPPTATGREKTKTTGRLFAVGNEVMLSGDLHLISVPDILEFCRSGQRSGRLVFESDGGEGNVRMHKGRIIDAASPKADAGSLLTRLLESGDASDEQVREIAASSDGEQDALVIARRLIDGGFTDPEVVRKAMVRQIQSAIREMIGWTEGSFVFNPSDDPSTSVEPVVEIDGQVVLLQIFKEQDEAAR